MALNSILENSPKVILEFPSEWGCADLPKVIAFGGDLTSSMSNAISDFNEERILLSELLAKSESEQCEIFVKKTEGGAFAKSEAGKLLEILQKYGIDF